MKTESRRKRNNKYNMHRLLIEQIRRTTNTATTRNKRAHNNKRQLNNGIVPEPHTKQNKRQHQQKTIQNAKNKTKEQTTRDVRHIK